MANIESFLKGKVREPEERKEIKVSNRFDEPFVVKPISEKENAVLRKSCTSTRIAKGGNRVTDTDTEKYVAKLMTSCVVEPDLQNSELQTSWGTPGSAIETLKAMLLPGEYAELGNQIQEFLGFDVDINEVKEEAKN
ncbi:phage tail assembly chaperone [Bavariicoccus seileri]|uniref:phage tail assembly chaperone n=1 Tax=Bavariicoccus seileri TaxID=549685 RepID=UPI0003B320B7|nr:phage portal protein [Bavariicoccus seileri]